MEDIQQIVLRIIAEQVGIDSSEINLDSELWHLRDSLDVVEVVMELEDEFEGVRLDGENETGMAMKTVRDLIQEIRRQRGEGDDGAGVGARLKKPRKPPGEAGRTFGDN